VRRITFPLYVGGFLGPFGGAMLVALIPNVAVGLDASLAQVAAAITAYMVPFALLQLVSGTIAERLGPRRVVRGGYVAFAAAAVACALAPDIWTFLAARAAMGAANAVLVLVGAEEFDLRSGARGLLIAGYGIGGILLGRYAGTVVDRAGRPATALAGAIACTAGVLGLVVAPSPGSLGLVFFGIGCASAFVWAGLNTIAVESFPENRAGATSAYSAFKFAGVAIAPLIYVPLFNVDTRLPFLLAAGFSALLAVSVVPWFGRYR